MDSPGDDVRLRRLVLTVSVLADLDVEPAGGGLVLSGRPDVLVPWEAVAEAVAGVPLDSGTARHRLTTSLRLRRLVADWGDEAAGRIRAAARATALPPGHALHPGAGWARQALPGGALECGAGLVDLLGGGEAVPLPPWLARSCGVDVGAWWPALRQHAEDMGRLVVHRLSREPAARQQVLRPVGGVDVPSLLLSPTLRRHLATEDGSGMRAVAVPMRSRGWFDLARIDPAFVGAAWSATSDTERGLPVPLLVTADEVGAAPVARTVLDALADPVLDARWRRDVRYR